MISIKNYFDLLMGLLLVGLITYAIIILSNTIISIMLIIIISIPCTYYVGKDFNVCEFKEEHFTYKNLFTRKIIIDYNKISKVLLLNGTGGAYLMIHIKQNFKNEVDKIKVHSDFSINIESVFRLLKSKGVECVDGRI